MGFNDLHRKARLLEQSLESKFERFSRIFKTLQDSHTISLDGSVIDSQLQALLDDIKRELNDLIQINDNLHFIQDEILSSSHTFALERHQSQCNDFQIEFKRISNLLKERSMRFDLLGRDSYQNKQNLDPRQIMQETENRLSHANASLQQMISLGKETNEEFGVQRQRFTQVNSSLSGIRARFPMINNILLRIESRQRRDRIILSCVMGFFIAAFIILVFF